MESELGKGSTFRALFPASPEVAKSSAPYVPTELPSGDSELVLIVDDEQEIVSGIQRMLENKNYRVLVAKNGLEALALIQRHGTAIDALVTDITMPEMDGVQLIRMLRKDHPRLQIIASSGLGSEKGGSLRARELNALGVNTFLAKPYTMDKLLAALRSLLANGKHACAVVA
jgi:CheY-like chemotaxis protein